MENTTERSRSRTLLLTGIAMLVALVAAVPASAGSGAADAATRPAATPVQQTQTTPAPESGDARPEGRRGDGRDCPKEGGGAAQQQGESGTAAPATPTPAPSLL